MATKKVNPLQGYLRTPKLYILLPSQGKFSTLDTASEISGELPIYPLTSMDETLLRNPDALLNGESLVKVIQSCTGVKDVYNLSTNDVDVILLAARFATYGEELEIEATCPDCSKVDTININIEDYLETVEVLEDSYSVQVDSGLKCYLKPYTFKDSQMAALAAFKETSELNNLINSEADDLSRLATFNKSFQAMADLNMQILSNSVMKVIIPSSDGVDEIEVSEADHIEEWVRGISKTQADIIVDELNVINELGIKREASVTCTTSKKQYDSKLEFTPASFFDTGS